MAEATTIKASIGSTAFAELVVNELCLSLVPRIVALKAWCSSLVLAFFNINVRLRRTFEVCFYILKMPPSFTARSIFSSVTFKTIVTALHALTNIAVRAFLRWHRHRCFTPALSSSGTTISFSICGSREPQTILSSIIMQINQGVILACLPIGH